MVVEASADLVAPRVVGDVRDRDALGGRTAKLPPCRPVASVAVSVEVEIGCSRESSVLRGAGSVTR